MGICNRIMDWNCYGERHLGQEDCENNLNLGTACWRRLVQAANLICLPFLFHTKERPAFYS